MSDFVRYVREGNCGEELRKVIYAVSDRIFDIRGDVLWRRYCGETQPSYKELAECWKMTPTEVRKWEREGLEEVEKELKGRYAALYTIIKTAMKKLPANIISLEEKREKFERYGRDQLEDLVNKSILNERVPLLPEETIRKLIRQSKMGPYEETSKEVVMLYNRGLVAECVKKYVHGRSHLQFDDLLQEGMTGLQRAIEKFDLERKTKFSTYAISWIKQRLIRACRMQEPTVHVPEYIQGRVYRYTRRKQELEQQGRQNVHDEVCAELGLDAQQIGECLSLLSPASLDTVIGEENLTLGNTIEARQEKKQWSGFLDTILKRLDQRESDIIHLHYGLGCDKESRVQISKRYGLSPERIRQIENKAIERLRKEIVKENMSEEIIDYLRAA